MVCLVCEEVILRTEWDSRKQQVAIAYEQILRDLQKLHVDGEEYIQLHRRIEKLRPLQKKHEHLRYLVKNSTDTRRELVVEWEDVKAKEFRVIDQAAKKVSEKLRDRVKAQVAAGGGIVINYSIYCVPKLVVGYRKQ